MSDSIPSTPVVAEQPKPLKKKSSKWHLLWKIPLGLAGAFVGITMLGVFSSGDSTALPKCDSAQAEQMVQDAIREGPLSKILNVQILALKEQKVVSSSDDKLVCHAKGLTNAGSTAFIYTFSWINKDKGTFFVEVKEDL
jgi:hypothetical protein